MKVTKDRPLAQCRERLVGHTVMEVSRETDPEGRVYTVLILDDLDKEDDVIVLCICDDDKAAYVFDEDP